MLAQCKTVLHNVTVDQTCIGLYSCCFCGDLPACLLVPHGEVETCSPCQALGSCRLSPLLLIVTELDHAKTPTAQMSVYCIYRLCVWMNGLRMFTYCYLLWLPKHMWFPQQIFSKCPETLCGRPIRKWAFILCEVYLGHDVNPQHLYILLSRRLWNRCGSDLACLRSHVRPRSIPELVTLADSGSVFTVYLFLHYFVCVSPCSKRTKLWVFYVYLTPPLSLSFGSTTHDSTHQIVTAP